MVARERGGDLSPTAYRDLIDAARRVTSVEQVEALCRELCDRAGFEHYIYGAAVPVSLLRLEKLVLSGYPADWWERYQEQEYFNVDPILRHMAARRGVPLMWTDIDPDTHADSRKVRRFMNEATDFGLASGVSFVVHGQRSENAVFSLATRDSPARAEERIVRIMPVAQLLTAYLHEAALRAFRVDVQTVRADLTPRERECLLWAAEGKTSWDTGQILGISERTVLFHLQNAAHKLNVNNRAQAVARAVAQGYITPQFP